MASAWVLIFWAGCFVASTVAQDVHVKAVESPSSSHTVSRSASATKILSSTPSTSPTHSLTRTPRVSRTPHRSHSAPRSRSHSHSLSLGASPSVTESTTSTTSASESVSFSSSISFSAHFSRTNSASRTVTRGASNSHSLSRSLSVTVTGTRATSHTGTPSRQPSAGTSLADPPPPPQSASPSSTVSGFHPSANASPAASETRSVSVSSDPPPAASEAPTPTPPLPSSAASSAASETRAPSSSSTPPASTTPSATATVSPTPVSASMTPSTSPTKAPYSNLIVNGGFETGTLEGWDVYELVEGIITVLPEPHTGSYALFLGGSLYTQPYSSLNFVGQYPNLTLNTDYELSFWAMTTPQPLIGSSFHLVEVFLDDLPYPKFEMYHDNPGYLEYTLFVYPFTYDASFVSFVREGLRFGGYQWYIDDVELVQTSPL